MSISHLPNFPNPHLPAPSIPATAAVTRILVLSDFSPALKTRDLQAAFAQWENEKGGFRIKWIDDVTALVVFQDANIAKRAYLSLLLNPAPGLPPPAAVKPYDGPDAQAIIHSVTARQHGHAPGRASMSGAAAGLTSGSMAPAITGPGAGAGPGFGFAQGQGGISGYGGARAPAAAGGKPHVDGAPPALTGLGISAYGRHTRSASASSVSGAEPVHGRSVPPVSQSLGNGGGARIGGAHVRQGSSGSSAFGRNSAIGAFAFGTPGTAKEPPKDGSPAEGTYTLPPVSSSAAFRTQGTNHLGGLATHHETDTPGATPVKPTTLAPFNHGGEDASTPGIEILGAVPFPEGGPGGYLATKERRASASASGGASGGASSAGSGSGGGGGVDVTNGIRRESLDAQSAERALREVTKALEGLGVGVAVAAGKT